MKTQSKVHDVESPQAQERLSLLRGQVEALGERLQRLEELISQLVYPVGRYSALPRRRFLRRNGDLQE